MNFDELAEYLAEATLVPSNSSEPYVIHYELDDGEDGLRYSLFISSDEIINRFLCQPAEDEVMFALDHTYQLTVEDIPMMMVGQLQQTKHFIPFLCVLQNREDKEAFDVVLNYIKDKRQVPPVAILGDASKAFSASIKEQLPDTIRLTCWFHMIKAVRIRAQVVRANNGTVYNDIYEDLKSVHFHVYDSVMFNLVMGLFLRKYSEEYTFYDDDLKHETLKLIRYIMDTWARDTSVNCW